MRVFPTAVEEILCHTGTRCFMRSSAVSDDRAIVGNLIQVLVDLVGRHSDRAWQFLIRLSPGLRVPRIDKSELLAAIHPLRNLVWCNSCCFHSAFSYGTYEGHGYHEPNKFPSQFWAFLYC